MASDTDRHGVYNSADYTSIEIPEEIRKKLDTLPNKKMGMPLRVWQGWEDKIILDNFKTKRQDDLAKILNISVKTMVNRYRALTEGDNGNL